MLYETTYSLYSLESPEAGLAIRPGVYRWSSYNAYFGRAVFTWLETDRVLSYFGPTRRIALTKFAEFMEAKEDAAVDLEEIHRASRSGIYGSEEFKRSFVSVMNPENQPTEACSIEAFIAALCERFNVTPEQ